MAEALRARADAMGRETIRKSLQSYASRIKAFIMFMMIGICTGGVLSATPADMLLFLAIFTLALGRAVERGRRRRAPDLRPHHLHLGH